MEEFPKAVYLDAHVEKASRVVITQDEEDAAAKDGFLPVDPLNPFPESKKTLTLPKA